LPLLELAVTSCSMPAPIIELPPPPPGARVVVTRAELESAICVWLRTIPSRLWKPYLAMLEIDPKRRTEAHRADPREILGACLAGKFERIQWEASYTQPGNGPG